MSDREPRRPSTPEAPEDAVLERYLWDPAAPPADEVVRIERALAPLRYRERRLELPSKRRLPPAVPWIAAAALLLALGVAGTASWVWSWPAGRAWPVLHGSAPALAVGEAVRVPADESLLVRVARIGWMRVEGDAELSLLATTSNRHRVSLEEGTLRVGVWAPPGSFGVLTPAGEVLDLGCRFLLQADRRETRVDVTSGWVQLQNAWGESIVPSGAWSSMVSGRVPSAPLYGDAAPGFQAAAGALERQGGEEALRTLLATARPRDVLTLLVLATRLPDAREPLLRRAAELSPPASEELLERALAGDRHAIWAWIRELPLPPPKRWLPNWRDWWPG